MLLATVPGGAPRFLSGFGATAEEVAKLGQQAQRVIELQKALKQLAIAAQNPAIDPGPQIGLVGGLPPDGTMGAVAASLALINKKLPTWAAAALAIGLGVGATTTTAKKAVMDNADELRKAVIAATITAPYYTKPEEAPTPTETPTIFSTSGPWYKTWWGIGAIGVGALGLISLLAARRSA